MPFFTKHKFHIKDPPFYNINSDYKQDKIIKMFGIYKLYSLTFNEFILKNINDWQYQTIMALLTLS